MKRALMRITVVDDEEHDGNIEDVGETVEVEIRVTVGLTKLDKVVHNEEIVDVGAVLEEVEKLHVLDLSLASCKTA